MKVYPISSSGSACAAQPIPAIEHCRNARYLSQLPDPQILSIRLSGLLLVLTQQSEKLLSEWGKWSVLVIDNKTLALKSISRHLDRLESLVPGLTDGKHHAWILTGQDRAW